VQVVGDVAYTALGFPLFANIIYTFYGYHNVAWLMWFIIIEAVLQFIYDVVMAYRRSAPRRGLQNWISYIMYRLRADDPRLVDDVCGICFAQPRSRDEMRETICFHMYHITCLSQWLMSHTTCPTCRYQLRQPGPPPVYYNNNYNTNWWRRWLFFYRA
jgi:hypothetical protein